MTLEQYREGSRDRLSGALQALWLDHHGDWEAAHQIAQESDDADSAWVHAYLHRKQGDIAHARYWYRRAGRPLSNESLQSEWEAMAVELLARRDSEQA